MDLVLKPIGIVRTDEKNLPRHCSISQVEGVLVIQEQYLEGLDDIHPGDSVVVLFHFHKSSPFTNDHMKQTPPGRDKAKGVFSICSPVRPNPLGMSVVTVLKREGPRLIVRGMDMIDGTPILDLKPLVREGDASAPKGNDGAPETLP